MTRDHESDGPISRRTFVRLSAATGTALALPGNATAAAESGAFDAEYQYVLNHTPADHAVPTLVTFSDAGGLTAFESMVDTAVTTTEPQPAAYAQLTTVQAQSAAELPTADRFQFAPGSNPFWRIGYYPLGVFPEAERSVDFIGFEQLKDGLDELESRYPDRVRVKQMAGDGQSPGHLNDVTGREDPKKMMLAEVTNFDSDVPFEDKEKVFYSCGLHGLERAGVEAGARIIENIARGDQFARGPDETKQSVTELLDDAVLIFGFTNPDGWVARNPQYASGWQLFGPTGAPGAPLHERGNAEIYDTNRQYPVVGIITPNHYPGDPATVKDNERGQLTRNNVPDAMAIVEHFRGYENLNYGADLHGGPVFNEFVLGLISQDQYDTRELHETYEMCRVIDEVLEDELEVWHTAGEAKTSSPLGETDTSDIALFGVLPEESFDYAGIFDTIDYNVSGAMLDWMSHPEEFGGLGMTTLDFEMSFSHMTGGNVYNPALLDMEVRGYRTAIRTIARFAVANSNTPNTEDTFSVETKTRFDEEADPQRVAYVTTGAVGGEDDALRRHSGTLDFGRDSGGGGDGGGFATSYDATTVSETVGVSETVESTFTVEESGLHTLYAHPHARQAFLDLELVSPDGEVISDFEAITDTRAGGKCCGAPEFNVSEPATGEWTMRMTNVGQDPAAVQVQFGTLAANATNPDPVPGVGYEQRDYDVTPFRFFEDYADSIEDDGELVPVTVEEVASGRLVQGEFDHAVVVHDYGANAGADYIGSTNGYDAASSPTPGYDVDGYVEALDEFVDGGGNLVLTDMGLNLLPELDNGLVGSGQFDGALSTEQYVLGKVTSKELDTRLMTDVRPIQRQLIKSPPLGYHQGSAGEAVGEFPMRLVDEAAFTSTPDGVGATVAGTTNGSVGVGSITPETSTGTGIHVISSLLPPATQKNLHPFGMVDYAVSFLGYLLLTSALGFQQVRETAAMDEPTTYGAGPGEQVETGPDLPAFTADGTRSDDGQVFTGGQTDEITVTVQSLSHAADVNDTVPDGWSVVTDGDGKPYGDATGIDGTTVSFGRIGPVGESDAVELTYYAEAPSGAGDSNSYTFGPAVAEAANPDDVENAEAQVAGTDTNYVVGTGTGAL